MPKLFPDYQVECKADPIHLSQSLICQTMSSTFSQCMSAGKMKEAQKELQQALALDLADRSHIGCCRYLQVLTCKSYVSSESPSCLLQRHVADHAGNIKQIVRCMSWVVSATTDRCAGNCSHCHKCGMVCFGGVRKGWWRKSFHLTTGCCI